MDYWFEKLTSGGIMTNYNCTVKCSHCRHNASPDRSPGFIEQSMLQSILSKLEEFGCISVHLEGGEPFIYPKELLEAVKLIQKSNINLEHVVTNCSWYKNKKDTIQLLKDFKKYGLNRLLIKVGPFQNEAIPLKKVENVKSIAEQVGINVMIWDCEFYPDVASFESNKTHSIKKYLKRFGPDYINKVARKISINYAGRSFDTYTNHLKGQSIEKILAMNKTCIQDYPTHTHFHVDKFGNFSFSHTQGVTIALKDLGKPVTKEKYPYLHLLMNEGIHGIYNLAINEYQFKPKLEYISKCHICYDIRKHIVNQGVDSPDLQPIEYYSI